MIRLLCVCLLTAAVSLRAAETPEPGQTYFGRNRYIEYIAGSLPFVLSAAHGGRDKPEELPDRAKGTFAFDTNTQELARAIDDEFVARTGQHPHVVICRVTRRKIDCNREIVEGAAGHPLTEQTWKDFQGFIQTAQKAVVAASIMAIFRIESLPCFNPLMPDLRAARQPVALHALEHVQRHLARRRAHRLDQSGLGLATVGAVGVGQSRSQLVRG